MSLSPELALSVTCQKTVMMQAERDIIKLTRRRLNTASHISHSDIPLMNERSTCIRKDD